MGLRKASLTGGVGSFTVGLSCRSAERAGVAAVFVLFSINRSRRTGRSALPRLEESKSRIACTTIAFCGE